MTSAEDKVRELQKLLKEQTQRAEKAEEKLAQATQRAKQATQRAQQASLRAEQAEKENEVLKKVNQDQEDRIVILEKAAPHVFELGTAVLKSLKKCSKDLPEVDLIAYLRDLQQTLSEFDRLPQVRVLSRLFIKGSEKLSSKALDKGKRDWAHAAKDNLRDIKYRHNKLSKSMDAMGQAALEAADQNEQDVGSAVKAIAEIERMPSPPRPEFEAGELLGKQTAKALSEAPEQKARELTHCPSCGSSNLQQGKEFCNRLRTLSAEFNSLAELMAIRGHHVLCKHCNSVHYVGGTDVPVAPGRTIGQETAIAAGVLNVCGTPLNQVQPMIMHSDDQLGNDTLGRNIHDWATTYGNALVEAAKHVLNSQHVRMVDETPFDVLQSQGNGICKEIPEDERRQKDYLLVQASAPHEPRQVVAYDWIGSRSAESITGKLGELHNRVLVADGYQVYDSLTAERPELRLQGCCAHLRRYILDAINEKALHDDLFQKGNTKAIARAMAKLKSNSPAHLLCGALLAMSKIYGYEKGNTRRSGESEEAFAQRVKENRQQYAVPLMQHFDTIMEELAGSQCKQNAGGKYEAATKNSAIAQAVCYYMNRRESFKTFLSEPLTPPDNNRTERAVRAIATLRKATNFKQSQDRAQSLCIMMSLNEMAKANGVKSTVRWLHDYGVALFEHMARRTLTARLAGDHDWERPLKKFDDNATEGFDFEAWLPWNYQARLEGK